MQVNRIRFKNFLSYGNSWTELYLSDCQLTAVVSGNGQGKTSILHALTFGLYGRTLTNIPKNKIVNSINQKQCVVEVEFEANGENYRIIRGIKPTIFQIYKNGKLINEDSNSRDYQSVIEQQILRMNFKTFIQTVVIGMSNFTPFMELSTNDRRVVVEDLLGVGILATMSQLLKEQIQTNNEQISNNANEIAVLKSEIDGDRRVLDTIRANVEQAQTSLISQRDQYIEEITNHQKAIDKLSQTFDKLQPAINKFDSFKKSINTAVEQQGKLNALISRLIDDTAFVTTNDNCPLCHQSIDDKYRAKIVNTNNTNKAKLEQQLAKVRATLDKLQSKQQKFINIINKSNDIAAEIREHNGAIATLNHQIDQINHRLNTKNDHTAITAKENEIREKANDARKLLHRKEQLLNQSNVLQQGAVLLKDSGIKTAVIDQYLPIINQMINKYLSDMEFYLSFEFDNQFNETIKARGRDDMTYSNLSQGEKRRLDLAIMFTWRYIAQLRNSCKCTNIFVDEVLDSSLDAAGIDSVMKLFRSFDDSHILIISHRESVHDLEFDKVVSVSKTNQYSEIVIE